MNEKIGQAFAELSKKLGGAPIIPAGDAIWAAYQEEPVKLVIPDPDFDYKNPVHPKLPNQTGSLHNGYRWSKDKKTEEWKLAFDASHLNVRGRYLVGCLFYAFLFKQDIIGRFGKHPRCHDEGCPEDGRRQGLQGGYWSVVISG